MEDNLYFCWIVPSCTIFWRSGVGKLAVVGNASLILTVVKVGNEKNMSVSDKNVFVSVWSLLSLQHHILFFILELVSFMQI